MARDDMQNIMRAAGKSSAFLWRAVGQIQPNAAARCGGFFSALLFCLAIAAAAWAPVHGSASAEETRSTYIATVGSAASRRPLHSLCLATIVTVAGYCSVG